MSDKMERQAGTTVDGWKLDELLGAGGNGEVWKASRDGVQAAVKFLKSAFAVPGNKRFARFRDEARMQRQLPARHPGVLPLLDSYIPDEPSPGLPVWLAAPIAVPVTIALKECPLIAGT
jgi:serine/threonine protein kinase